MNNKEIVIPMGQLIKRSLLNVLLNIRYFFKITVIPMVIVLLLPFLGQTSYVATIIPFVISIYISVCWCRKIILDEDSNFKNIPIKQTWNYFCKYLMFILILIAPSLILFMIYVGINFKATEIMPINANLYALLLLAMFLWSIFCVRLRMTLAAAAVEDKDLDISLAIKLTKNNTLRLWSSFIVIALPVSLFQILINFILVSANTGKITFIVMIITYLSVWLSNAFYASYDAHVYQYFMYFYRKKIEDGEAQEAGEFIEEKINRRRNN